ncbi:MAG: hypothetical protein JNK76_11800 [Planctomycetales bacterium]|nr:hypothetical protein [Planctomycetales bacterium]MBN8624247.1 hypothetical protein [Planctomycetota bacterium]
MFVRALVALFVGWLPLVVAAGEHVDPSGYRFTYPDGWTAITKDIKHSHGALPKEVSDWIEDNKVDLSKLSVVVIRNGEEEFLENMNVVVEKQQMPLDEKMLQELVSLLPQQYKSMGADVTIKKSAKTSYGPNDALMVEYTARLPGVPMLLEQRQVFFTGGGKTFIVTCTGAGTNFVKYGPAFDKILASFDVPARTASSFDWGRVFSGGVNGAVIGGLVGLLGGLAVMVKKLFAKKQQPPAPPLEFPQFPQT